MVLPFVVLYLHPIACAMIETSVKRFRMPLALQPCSVEGRDTAGDNLQTGELSPALDNPGVKLVSGSTRAVGRQCNTQLRQFWGTADLGSAGEALRINAHARHAASNLL